MHLRAGRRFRADEYRNLLLRYLTRFPEEERTVRSVLRDIERTDRDDTRSHLTASGIVFHRRTRRLLLIYHSGLRCWLQPGGHIAPGETPCLAAQREVKEETGLQDVELHPWHKRHGIPIDVNSHEILEQHPEGRHIHHDLRYVFWARSAHPLRLGEERSPLCGGPQSERCRIAPFWVVSLLQCCRNYTPFSCCHT